MAYRSYYAKTNKSGFRDVLSATPNTVLVIPFPNQDRDVASRPHRMRIWFMDASNTNPVMGRMAFSGDGNPHAVLNDSDGTLGTFAYVPAQIDDAFDVSGTQNYLLVASSTASAIVYISWYYA